MKLLVYGAGVIGSYLAHALCAAGNDVTVLARGSRKAELEQNGLVIRHHLQKTTTLDRPRIVGGIGAEPYDIVFAVMQYQQMRDILDDLAAVNSPLVVLVGNNLSASDMEAHIKAHTVVSKTVAFGFQTTGGRRENGGMVCVRQGNGKLHCGLLHAPFDERTKAALLRAFGDTGYRLAFQPDMEGWYRSHLAFILPVAYLCYALDCDLTRAKRVQLNLCLDAAREGFALLRALGTPILPSGEDAYFELGAKRAYLAALLWVAAKTALGRLIASDHCRNAVAEMRALDAGFEGLRRESGYPMPHWDALRARMPSWDEIERQYKKQ